MANSPDEDLLDSGFVDDLPTRLELLEELQHYKFLLLCYVGGSVVAGILIILTLFDN